MEAPDSPGLLAPLGWVGTAVVGSLERLDRQPVKPAGAPGVPTGLHPPPG